jgi:hypothetical protein
MFFATVPRYSVLLMSRDPSGAVIDQCQQQEGPAGAEAGQVVKEAEPGEEDRLSIQRHRKINHWNFQINLRRIE